ncbi:hypothetical protein E2C01_060196 [Portunus trituberculatus]|uniref:Uncharacterized protein n=1 Tax=Portunus trituberculatus TaxID=210409 RepID=A0A5B7H7D8_PORTR|nr:hypothetical protein [Portunus trituberculatus]
MQCPIWFCKIFFYSEHHFEALIHYFTHFLLCLVCLPFFNYFFYRFLVLHFAIYEFVEKPGFIFAFTHHILLRVSFFLSPYSNILISRIPMLPCVIVISLFYEFLPSFIFCLFRFCAPSIVPIMHFLLNSIKRYVFLYSIIFLQEYFIFSLYCSFVHNVSSFNVSKKKVLNFSSKSALA